MSDWSREPSGYPASEPTGPDEPTFRADLTAADVRRARRAERKAAAQARKAARRTRKGPKKPRRRVQPATQDPARRRRRLQKRAMIVFSLTLVAVAGAWLVVWGYLFKDLPGIPDDRTLWSVNRMPGMTFQDRTGAVIATRGARNGYRIRVRELPPHVPLAFLAAEDRRFYRHGPVDLRGIGRALWTNITEGRVAQGGSTLTQQIARTLFLSPERTLKRKLQEAIIAFQLERRMTKDEVFELYLNRVFFGSNAYGIDAAAEVYFGKPSRALTLPEAALLAALPKAPSRLALDRDYEAALQRSYLVLGAMREENWINDVQLAAAKQQRPPLTQGRLGDNDFGYVLDLAAAEAARRAGQNGPDLVIRVSIDSGLQRAGQDILRQTIAREGRRSDVSQGALVALAPDGAIRAIVGGLDHRQSPFNRAVQARRQPGSTFKPFVYAAALEEGVRPFDIRSDSPVRFGNWRPANYGGGYSGAVTVEQALVRSINTVAVRLGAEVGRQKLAQISHRFGLDSIPDEPGLAVALGAYEVNLLDLTAGFQVFQNAGQRVSPYLIESITTTRGDLVWQRTPTASTLVYDPELAGDMVRMMTRVVSRGTATRAQFGRPAAGKTGTSQTWRDAWFVGFTPDFVAGVWVGNDDDTPTNRVAGGAMPAEIWRRFMVQAHRGLPVRGFDWLPPEDAAPPRVIVPELEAEPEVAQADPRSSFYDQLASELGAAAEAGEAAPAGN